MGSKPVVTTSVSVASGGRPWAPGAGGGDRGAGGPGRARGARSPVSGPLVEGCGPEDGADATRRAAPLAARRRSSRRRTSPTTPARGWSAGGDASAAPPAWPDMPPMTDLMAETGMDPAPVRRAIGRRRHRPSRGAGARRWPTPASTPCWRGPRRATKALLRPGRDGGRELRLHTSYPFGSDYLFEAEHAVPGWGDAEPPGCLAGAVEPDQTARRSTGPTAPTTWRWRSPTPPADGRRLAHSGYGWWTVAPVGMFPERIVAAKARPLIRRPGRTGCPKPARCGAGA